MDAEPDAGEAILQLLGSASPVYVNFAISGIQRVVRELRAALYRRKREVLVAHQAAEDAFVTSSRAASQPCCSLAKWPSKSPTCRPPRRSNSTPSMSWRRRCAASWGLGLQRSWRKSSLCNTLQPAWADYKESLPILPWFQTRIGQRWRPPVLWAGRGSGLPGPMHVLVTADTLSGVWTYTRELVSGLVSRGVRVTLVSFGGIPLPQHVSWMDTLHGLEYHPTAFRLDWMQEGEQDLKDSFAYLEGLGPRAAAGPAPPQPALLWQPACSYAEDRGGARRSRSAGGWQCMDAAPKKAAGCAGIERWSRRAY